MIRVVAVDDHPVILKSIHEDLANLPDIQLVGCANHGSKLFDLLREHAPDVLILDLGMTKGEFDPISAVRRLRQEHPNVQILIFTGDNNPSYMRELTAEGVRGYVLKSDDLSLNLAEAVRTVYDGRVYYSKEVSEILFSKDDGVRKLSQRELQVLRLVAAGWKYNDIANDLNISENRVRNIMTHVYEKMGIQEENLDPRTVLIKKAQKMGLLLE